MNQRPPSKRPTKRPLKYIEESLSEKNDMEENPKTNMSFKKPKLDVISKVDQKSKVVQTKIVKPGHDGKKPFNVEIVIRPTLQKVT